MTELEELKADLYAAKIEVIAKVWDKAWAEVMDKNNVVDSIKAKIEELKELDHAN